MQKNAHGHSPGGHQFIPIPSEATKVDLNRILLDAIVHVSGYHYVVDLGPDVKPRLHTISKEKRCNCIHGKDCPAIAAVTEFLRKGGERAPDPPPGYFPVAPEKCPICNAPAYHEPRLNRSHLGAGWGCSKTGEKHYWRYRSQLIQEALKANPWLFPPVVIRAGEQIKAWDGILPGDIVLYEGVLRADVVSST